MQHHVISAIPRQNRPRRFDRVAVLGAGSWGTAVAATFAKAGVSTRIWGRDTHVCDAINARAENPRYLPGIPLPANLHAVHEMPAALDGADAVAIIVPSRSVRSVSRQVAEYLSPTIPVAVCAKGIEAETGLLMTQVAEEELGGNPVGCVSGPTFAAETALGHPTAATVAFPFSHRDRLDPDQSPAVRMAMSLSTESFRAYVSDDLVGCGDRRRGQERDSDRLRDDDRGRFAENTRAALITRGVDEMKALAEALGGRRETVTGLSGMGDLTLTCSSPTSRNMSLGLQLGQGIPRKECFDGSPSSWKAR
jgi:glycerol-3-phosphate dehydrogenase (NAD(P)+)